MKILLVQTGFLGDVILSTPVITNLHILYPSAKLEVMTTPAAEPLVRYHPAVSRTIVFDKRGERRGVRGFMAMRRDLAARDFKVVFSLHKSLRTALLLRAAEIPVRYGFRETAGRMLYTATVPRSDQPHDVLRNLAILRAVGHEPAGLDQRIMVAVNAEAEAEASELLSSVGEKAVGIAPGSVWLTKRWTPDGFAAVGRALREQGRQVVLVGGPEDVELGAGLEREIGSGVLNLIGKTSLLTSAAVIKRLALLITNDSAPLHLASAMGTPVVALFCATVPEFGFGPWQIPAEIIGVSDLSCRPCGRHGGKTCPTGTHACRLRITPEMVLNAVERLEQRRSERGRSNG